MTTNAPNPHPDRTTLDALRAEGSFLRLILDMNPTLIFAKDREGRFTLVNKTVADLYGTSVDDLIGKTDADFDEDPAEVAFFRRMDLQVMDTLEELFIPEEAITDRQGRRHWLQTVKRPIVDPDGKANQVLGVSTDITHRRELEEQLRQSQKMDALGQLAGGLAHDFNNLLAVILGNTERLLAGVDRQPGLPPSFRSSLELIQSAGDRAAALVSKLLACSRRQPVRLEAMDLGDMIVGIEQMVRSLLGEQIELKLELHEEDLPVEADHSQLEQVLINLVVNARDAMPDGGRLTIRTTPVVKTDTPPHAAGPPPRTFACMEINDTGVGMPPEIIEHIFEPFFTTKEQGKGTGLGLSIVYGIVRRFDGEVCVDSTPGRGSTFFVYLPLAAQRDAVPTPAPTPARLRGHERILVCEDEPSVLDLVRKTLEDHGYRVVAADHAEAALEACRQASQPFDLLLTDVIMPGMNGRELAEQASALVPGLQILYMTGYSSDVLGREKAEKASWIAKPFRSEELLRQVRHLLDEGD